MMAEPFRGDVWNVDLNPTRGREQSGHRPALIVSHDRFNKSVADLVVVVPITSTERGIPLHVRIAPPEGGLRNVSFAKCEDVRSVSKERLTKRLGATSPRTMELVTDRLRILLDL
jgi:mRNA interferase MazF